MHITKTERIEIMNDILAELRTAILEEADLGFVWGDEPEGFELVDDIDVDSGRWQQYKQSILEHKESGRLFAVDYSVGLTEMQENEPPSQTSDIYEVEKVEVVAYEYKEKK